MTKKFLLSLILIALLISIWVAIDEFRDRPLNNWTTIQASAAPKAVVDTLSSEFRQKRRGLFIVLDPEYTNSLSIEQVITKRFYFLDYSQFIIKFKGKEIRLNRKEYNPPFVIYEGRLYCTAENNLTAANPLQAFWYIQLLEAQSAHSTY